MGNNGIYNLRAALARRERGRGKRYPSRLQRRIAGAAIELRGQGYGWQAIGKVLGIPHETVRRFSGASTTTGLVPVEIVDEAKASVAGLTLVSPEGYRIEGLGVGDAVEILRRLR